MTVTRDGQDASSPQCYASTIKTEAMVQKPIDSETEFLRATQYYSHLTKNILYIIHKRDCQAWATLVSYHVKDYQLQQHLQIQWTNILVKLLNHPILQKPIQNVKI